MNHSHRIGLLLTLLTLTVPAGRAQEAGAPIARLSFEGDTANEVGSSHAGVASGDTAFVRGVEGRALRLRFGGAAATLTLEGSEGWCDPSRSFAVQCWVRTTAETSARMVLLAQKDFPDNSLAAQKAPGWVFTMSHGTWGWNVGAGKRRITYERDNGAHMPLNDGRWHQLTMSYDSEQGQVWLYYDGRNRAIYNLRDSSGFDFANARPLTVGWEGTAASPREDIVPLIRDGAETLQQLVDTFDAFDVDDVAREEFVRLIVEPKRMFEARVRERTLALGADGEAFAEAMRAVDLKPLARLESRLMQNPYTVHQAFSFMAAAPLLEIYSLVDGKVTIDDLAARAFTERERLYPSDFDVDELGIWDRALSAEEVLASYAAHFEPARVAPQEEVDILFAGVWNIFHGGIHFTVDEHGWDSRVAIAQILEREGIDVLMLQETYSSGDFLAAELGWYFATSVDWDYLNQGANISVLSRYPIREVQVPAGAAFMNVAARVALSPTQDVWVMSNWYGMQQFAEVFEFHQDRFAGSATAPILFGGDFNAVPHTDGGRSPASEAMLGAGFTDAYRSLFPDVGRFPGFSHRSGSRIDQLYYKGAGLKNTSTEVISTWPTGFPSDHYLIRSVFVLR